MDVNKVSGDLNEYYEKFATEFCKYEALARNGPKNKKTQEKITNAYNEIAKKFQLDDIETVKLKIQEMKKYVSNRLRFYVRQSIIKGCSAEDALDYAPQWIKLLDKRLKLFQAACMIETLNSFKYYKVRQRVGHFTLELIQSARRAAARALANDGAGGEEGRCGGRGADARLALTGAEAMLEYADSIDVDVEVLHKMWTRIYTQSMYKLMALVEAGDFADDLGLPVRPSSSDWLVLDSGLLYDTRLRLISEKTFKSSQALQPLILLYKLMVAAHEKIKQNKAILATSSGAQNGTNEESSNTTENMPSCSNTENITTSVLNEQSEENVVNERKKDKKGSKEYETKEIWALVHDNYINSGRIATAVMLQKRWYEMKHHTRALLGARKPPPAPWPVLLALGKRFPYTLTEKLPPWSELVKNNQVFQDTDLESYKAAYAGTRLEVPREISEEILFDDLYDWSDDEVEVIDEQKETITINDSDDEQTDTRADENTIDKNISESNVDDDNVIRKLESIDPTTAKVKIIFEDDSDSDINDFINETDVNISKNTNSSIMLDNTESFNVKSGKTINSDENNSNTNYYGNKDILLLKKQSSEVSDIKAEINKVIENSVSINQIETKGQDEVGNHNRDGYINMDNLINDLRDRLTEKVDKLSSYTNKLIIQTQNEIHENDVGTKLDIADTQSNIENNFEGSQSFSDNGILDDDNESIDDGPEKHDPVLVDEKLVKLTHVVLIPIEHLPVWRKFSRNATINCRRFSVRNFARTVHITSDELKYCRRYVPKTSSNGISISKNREIDLIPKDLRRKRKILTRRLKLSRTYFSGAFWSERNIALMERCRPLALRLAGAPGSARPPKRIALADIDEVRRINKTILTAQVAPITVGANQVIDPSTATSKTTESIQNTSIHSSTDDQHPLSNYKRQESNIPSITLKIVQEDEGEIVDTLIENNFIDDATEDTDSNQGTKELSTELEVKSMIKKIVTKSALPKLPQITHVYSKTDNSSKFANKQKELKKDLEEISKVLLKRFSLTIYKPKKHRNKKSKNETPLPTENLSSFDEWQRQKQQNLVYFNFRPKLDDEIDSKKSNDYINEYTNKKRKKPKKKDKTNTNNINDDNLDNINKSESSVTSNYSSNSDNSDESSENNQKVNKAIKRKHSITESDSLNKIKKLELSENTINTETKPNNIIEISDDSDDEVLTIDPSVSSNNSNNENEIQITSDPNNSQINTNERGNDVNKQKNSGLISLLSKVARKIQDKKISTAESPQNNSNMIYIVQCCGKNNLPNSNATILDSTNSQESNPSTSNDTNALASTSKNFYVVKIPKNNSLVGSNTTVISPLPDLPGPMPVIQSVSSLSQLSTNQITSPNQTIPNPNQITLNQKSTNLPNSTDTNWNNTFENIVKRPSATNESHIVTPVPLSTTPMPLIQSVSSLRQIDQENSQNRPFDTNQSQIADSSIKNLQRKNSEVLPITAVTSRPVREDLVNQNTSKALDNTICPIVVSSGPSRSRSVETERIILCKNDETESLNVFETLKNITEQMSVLKDS